MYELPWISATKNRDSYTGRITNIKLNHTKVKDQKILIVDDICDGGGTFCMLADQLYKKGAKEVNLFTTHGIFSKGLKPLYEAQINRIFTVKGVVSEVQGNICYEKI